MVKNISPDHAPRVELPERQCVCRIVVSRLGASTSRCRDLAHSYTASFAGCTVVNETVGLLRASGSLFIDIFDRHGFTADANAMLIGLLEDFAEAEQAVGNITAYKQLLNEAQALRSTMEDKLWASTAVGASLPVGRGGNDHFVTAMLDDERSFYDMVDYDANLIAVVRVLVQSQPDGINLCAIETSHHDKHLHACLLLTGNRHMEHLLMTPVHGACSHA